MEHFIDIPKSFHSDGDGKAFENCLVCGKYLLDGETSYVIEKAMKNYDGYEFSSTIYEYAICGNCHLELQKGMSEESILNMQDYYGQKIMLAGKHTMTIDLRTFDLDKWLSKCFFTEKPVGEMKEYQLIGQFKGNKLLLNTPPMVIGEDIIDDMAGLLSDKTIDEMNGFKERHLGPPPELEELIYGRKLIFL
ncbi:MAG: hypothetical protein GXO88_00650 [Chlorobi bacterium]|nr:hypothetical protein [Chlorobiota bacterium]